MAKTVKDFQFRIGTTKYKEEWVDGQTWELSVGPKGDVSSPKAAEAAIRKLAASKGKKCNIKYDEDKGSLFVRAFDAEITPPKPRKAKK